MDIYQPIIITDAIRINFKPTRLYIKRLNGLKYFGKTTKENVYDYPGSGRKWLNHIKKYGKDNVCTLWVSDWFFCPVELQDVALGFSKYHQIVESNDWANLCPENGLSGGKILNNYFSMSNYNNLPRTPEHKAAIGNAHRGRIKSESEKARHVAYLQTEPAREYLRQQNTGLKFWTNGTEFVRSKECPGDGWKPGTRKRINKRRKVKINGQIFSTLKDAAAAYNVHYTSIKHWIKIGKAFDVD